MAHTDKNIVITPNVGSTTANPKIVFSGADSSTTAQNITITATPANSGTLSFTGPTGNQIFAVNNASYGSLFTVNDSGGYPILDIISTTLNSGYSVLNSNFKVSGEVLLSNALTVGGNTNFYGSMGVYGSILATGNITAYYSDARLKDFVGTIPNALEKVSKLNGYYFYENTAAKALGYNNDQKQVGVSAQEVEAVLPEIVTSAPINQTTSTDYKTVYYDKLVPLLIEAIKELNQKVADLESQLQAE